MFHNVTTLLLSRPVAKRVQGVRCTRTLNCQGPSATKHKEIYIEVYFDNSIRVLNTNIFIE